MIFGKELLLCVDRPREILAVLPGPNIGVRGCNARLHFLVRRVADHPGHPLGSLVAAHLAGYREELARDWRRLDERIEGLSNEIEHLARQDPACERLD